jgi:hypothetical protein
MLLLLCQIFPNWPRYLNQHLGSWKGNRQGLVPTLEPSAERGRSTWATEHLCMRDDVGLQNSCLKVFKVFKNTRCTEVEEQVCQYSRSQIKSYVLFGIFLSDVLHLIFHCWFFPLKMSHLIFKLSPSKYDPSKKNLFFKFLKHMEISYIFNSSMFSHFVNILNMLSLELFYTSLNYATIFGDCPSKFINRL